MAFCGVFKLKLHDDTPTYCFRLAAEDLQGVVMPSGPNKGKAAADVLTPGVYQACEEAVELFRAKITERLRKTPAIDHNGDAVCKDATLVHKDGAVVCKDPTPLMTLSADQHAAGNMLL